MNEGAVIIFVQKLRTLQRGCPLCVSNYEPCLDNKVMQHKCFKSDLGNPPLRLNGFGKGTLLLEHYIIQILILVYELVSSGGSCIGCYLLNCVTVVSQLCFLYVCVLRVYFFAVTGCPHKRLVTLGFGGQCSDPERAKFQSARCKARSQSKESHERLKNIIFVILYGVASDRTYDTWITSTACYMSNHWTTDPLMFAYWPPDSNIFVM